MYYVNRAQWSPRLWLIGSSPSDLKGYNRLRALGPR